MVITVDGKPKSNRPWKTKQVVRFSAVSRKGVLSHMSLSLEAKQALRARKDSTKALENELKNEKRTRIDDAKKRREEQEQRRIANEYKTSTYQQINPSKIKSMSKKQLRMIKKTSVNAKGQVELVNPWASNTKKERKKQIK